MFNKFFNNSFFKISFLIFVFSFFINTNISKANTEIITIPSDDSSVNNKITITNSKTDKEVALGSYYITILINFPETISNVFTIDNPTISDFGGYFQDTSSHNLTYQNSTIVGTFSTQNFTLPTQNFTSYNPPNKRYYETSFNNTKIIFNHAVYTSNSNEVSQEINLHNRSLSISFPYVAT